MNIQTISISQTDLASRSEASKFRVRLLKIINDDSSVNIDFQGVESISDSYADELFGILALSLGIEKFFRIISIINASDRIFQVIAANIHTRISSISNAA